LQTIIEGSRFISEDENPTGIQPRTEFRVDPNKRVDRWVIQSKWETPVLDFTNVKASALNLSTAQEQVVSGSPWKVRYWDNYYTNGIKKEGTTSGTFMTGSTGVWHQKGTIIGEGSSNSNKGYFLTIEDVVESGVSGLASKLGFIDFTEDRTTKSLKKAKAYRKRIGQVEDRKMVKEAVVAIPYVIREDLDNRIEFITFNNELYEKARNNVELIQRELDNVPISDSVTTISEYTEFLKKYQSKTRDFISDAPVNAIEYQLFMMKDYILPPSLDFSITGNDPFMMYFFQFRATFGQEDIGNIWQNLYPTSQNSAGKARYSDLNKEFDGRVGKMKDVSYVSHYLDTTSLVNDNLSPVDSIYNLFSPRNTDNKTRWLIFKVKERGSSNLEEIRKLSVDPRLSNIEKFEYIKASKTSKTSDSEERESVQQRALEQAKLQFNWPYDYFSFVELVKLEAKVDSYNYSVPSNNEGE
jgi:hypothetical protein